MYADSTSGSISKETKKFDKNQLNFLLKELSKNIRKLNGKYPSTEIILVGGASIVLNYNFRKATEDLDTYTQNFSSLKEAINQVTDKYNICNSWINDDFIKTDSFSSNLRRYSTFYREYSNCLRIYTVNDEYLIAMKCKSLRGYKNDMSDIIGILMDSPKNICFDDIDKAMHDLYDGWDGINPNLQNILKSFCRLSKDKLSEKYDQYWDIQAYNNSELIKENNPDKQKELSEKQKEKIIDYIDKDISDDL